MSIRLRALGLSTLAVLAFCAVAASGAQAAGEFKAEKYPVVLNGTQSGETRFTFGSLSVGSCFAAAYHGQLTGSSSTMQVTPEYAGCTLGSYTVTMALNGCTYGWNLSELTGANSGTGTESISCPAGKQFEVLSYKSNQLVCAFSISPQENLTSIKYQGIGSGAEAHVRLTTNLAPKATVLNGGKSTCGAAKGESTTLGFSESTDVAAYTPGEAPVGLRMGTPIVEGDLNTSYGQYPATVNASQAETNILHIGIRNFSCSEASMSGTLTAPTKSATLSPSYGNCTASGLPAEITTTKCTYTLNVGSEDSLGIGCSAGEILVSLYSTGKTEKICEYGIPGSQTIEHVVGSNKGEGATAYVELQLKELTIPTVNVLFAKSKLTCAAKAGEVMNGHYSGTLKASASAEGAEVGLLVG